MCMHIASACKADCESMGWEKLIFLYSCEIKSGSGLGMRLHLSSYLPAVEWLASLLSKVSLSPSHLSVIISKKSYYCSITIAWLRQPRPLHSCCIVLHLMNVDHVSAPQTLNTHLILWIGILVWGAELQLWPTGAPHIHQACIVKTNYVNTPLNLLWEVSGKVEHGWTLQI